jgi:hypothetical protein
MSNQVVDIRDTGRNSARTGDVRDLSDNVITSATSTTTGTIAVTADATYDVSFTQPADTSIKNLIMIANGNLVTAGASGDDIDFDLGTAAGGGQIIDEKAIADDGGPATSEAMTLSASLYSSAARTLHIRLKPLANDLATAATTVTFIIEFQHLGVTPD